MINGLSTSKINRVFILADVWSNALLLISSKGPILEICVDISIVVLDGVSPISGVVICVVKEPMSAISVNHETDQLTSPLGHSFGPPEAFIGGTAVNLISISASFALNCAEFIPSNRTVPETARSLRSDKRYGQFWFVQSFILLFEES